MPRKHNSTRRRQQNRRNRDRQQSSPQPVEEDRKPDPDREYRESQELVSAHLQGVVEAGYGVDPRDVAAEWTTPR